MIDKILYIKIYKASRMYHPKCKNYQCGITFEIKYESGLMSLFYVPYVSDNEQLHYYFCDLIDKGFKINVNQLGIIWGLICSLSNYITSENRGDK